MAMRHICIMTPCYNEEGNVENLYRRVRAAAALTPECTYEHLFIDNHSSDTTVDVLRRLAADDARVKVIVNARNFGHIRSPLHGFLQAGGDAVIVMAADLQDPPELIPEMVRHWQDGAPMVLGTKVSSAENGAMYWLRTRYYRLIRQLSQMETLEHFTGFGLYDRKVVEIIRQIDDPYPFFRGLIAEIGLPYVALPYHQDARHSGITKNNLYTLYDIAILGITSFSKAPLRVITGFGFGCALLSILAAFVYFIYKLLFWYSFSVGIAPIAIGIFFFASIQLVFIGILGEYVAAIHTQVLKRPLVIESERINFETKIPCADNRARSLTATSKA